MHSPRAAHPTLGMILLLGALTAFGAMTIDMYLPALPAIGREFAASPEAVQRTVSTFFLGLAAGQLVYGPLSDRIGRRPPLLGGIAIYVAASAACALAASIEMLTLGRLAQALGACAGMVMSRAIVRDLYDHQESARIFSLLMLVMGVAPIVAPVAGSLLLTVASWRWIFAILGGFGLLVGVTILSRLPESRSDATAETARGETPLQSYLHALGERRLVGYLLTGSLNGACLFTYIAGSPDLLINTYGIAPVDFGWVFGFNAFGLIAGSQINRAVLKRHASDTVLAVATPLVVLFTAAMLASALTGIGGMWGVLVPLFFVLSTFGFTGANTSAGALSVDPLRSGAVSSLLGAGSFAAGAGTSALASLFHDGTARPMATVMALCACGATAAFFGLARRR